MQAVFQAGALAPKSGIYEAVDETGTVLRRLALAKGEAFPVEQKTAAFRFVRPVHAKYTSVASAAAMEETTADFDSALRSLASK
jgi:hypothetical protein